MAQLRGTGATQSGDALYLFVAMDFVKRTADTVGLSSTRILFDQVQEIEGWARIPLANTPKIDKKSERSLTQNSPVTCWHGCYILCALLYIKNGRPGMGTVYFLKANYGSN